MQIVVIGNRRRHFSRAAQHVGDDFALVRINPPSFHSGPLVVLPNASVQSLGQWEPLTQSGGVCLHRLAKLPDKLQGAGQLLLCSLLAETWEGPPLVST